MNKKIKTARFVFLCAAFMSAGSFLTLLCLQSKISDGSLSPYIFFLGVDIVVFGSSAYICYDNETEDESYNSIEFKMHRRDNFPWT